MVRNYFGCEKGKISVRRAEALRTVKRGRKAHEQARCAVEFSPRTEGLPRMGTFQSGSKRRVDLFSSFLRWFRFVSSWGVLVFKMLVVSSLLCEAGWEGY
ncbi:hypothetical protein TNCV_4388401 [Trichonephila clavipes]|nr:hypothetical protein TNCV_4388401 [Trichonephila clavipes]